MDWNYSTLNKTVGNSIVKNSTIDDNMKMNYSSVKDSMENDSTIDLLTVDDSVSSDSLAIDNSNVTTHC